MPELFLAGLTADYRMKLIVLIFSNTLALNVLMPSKLLLKKKKIR